ncbi:MAG: alpha-xylosidase, partial [Eubacteriales bacterium]|nr:alpha-xylosidase [Eubacteriales bacterium]
MKFTQGFWLMRPGITPHYLVELRDYRIQEGALTVYVAHRNIEHRGNTLDAPLFILRYTSPLPDVIRVQIDHFKGQIDKGPHFTIHSRPTQVDIADLGGELTFATGKTLLRIEKNPFAARFYYDGQLMTQSAQRHFAYIKTADGQHFMREQLGLGVGECIYGLGERFTPYVKNGQVVDTWNEDGGTASEISYKNIPFYLSNRGYGVLVNHAQSVSFEVGSEAVSRTQFSVPGHKLDYFVIGGGSPKAALGNYTALTGRPELPPAWSFGLWLTTSFTTDYDEQTVNSFIDGMAQRDIPLRVFHFDCFWMKEYEWCNFQWDGDVFPDPQGMIRRLHEKGLKVCAWINPYIGQKSRLFDEGMEKGYLIKNAEGGVWQTDQWQAGMGLVDFTNPAACAWYCGYLKQLLDMGVDCFKTDFGERIPADGVYFDGSDPLKMHNYYTYLYNKAVHDLLVREKGESILFARSATVGAQQFPVHWGGDCSSNFESMAESLRGGLSLLSSGFGFWSHDMSGFEQTATPDVYKRWAAFGLLSSHSRLHGNSSYRVPWLFDDEAVDVVRFFS